MNVLKNMEMIFVVAVALSLSASAFAKAPAAAAPTVANSTKMIKVVITGKRLTAAEMAQVVSLAAL